MKAATGCVHALTYAHVSIACRYAATVFAYGQTGSGKTHTMSGYENSEGG